MGAENTAPVLAIVESDDWVRVRRSHWDHIADVMEQRERRVMQLENRIATLETANRMLADELDAARAQVKALQASEHEKTLRLMACHEGAAAAFQNQENEGNG